MLTLDRANGTIHGGGVAANVLATGMVIEHWCRNAEAIGVDLAGLPLEVWDTGTTARPHGILCMTVADAAKVLNPDPKPRWGKRP